MGCKKSNDRSNLIKQVKRSWRKIGRQFQHTNERMKEFNLFTIDDEIRLQEVKMIWRWEKNKIPDGLKSIITEVRDERLRNRKFTRDRKWKKESISYRLATRAMKEINEVSCARSKNGLKNKYRKIIQLNYNSNCVTRNCYICTRGILRTPN